MRTPRVLVVDDAPEDRELLVECLGAAGLDITEAVDGLDAWQTLEAEPSAFDVILLDRMMPRLSGLELLRRIKSHPQLKSIPVVLQTAKTSHSDVLDGIEAGAYYYLTKPFDTSMLCCIVRAAAGDHAEYKALQQEVEKGITMVSLMREGWFEIRTLAEARDLGAFLANACPSPEKVVIGLTELLINAIEHGNLGITYEEKSRLKENGGWTEEIERRQRLGDNADKSVTVHYEYEEESIRIAIRDDGEGFDWRPFLQIDPGRAFDAHGRGIAMANLISFDDITYLGAGNEVVAVIEL